MASACSPVVGLMAELKTAPVASGTPTGLALSRKKRSTTLVR